MSETLSRPIKPNMCPRCGFAYTARNIPREPVRARLAKGMRYGWWGPFGHARLAQAELERPFKCRCGAWLRRAPLSFGVRDVGAIVLLLAGWVFLAGHYAWARNAWVPGIAVGLWLWYRTSARLAIEELFEAPPGAK